MSGRLLIWVQHLLGSGHLRRAAAIARAAAARGLDTVVASGGLPLPHLDLGGARLVQLPPLAAADEAFTGLVGGDGMPPDDALLARRIAMLRALVEELHPTVLVTETFPFGRRSLRAEALALLEAVDALRPRPVVVSSVRDILQRPRTAARGEEMALLARRHYDRVLVHGDPALVAFAASFPQADRLGARVVYTGYVAAEAAPAREAGGPGADEVLVSAGGGATGMPLIAAAAAARPLSRRAGARTWRLLAGDRAAPTIAGIAPGTVIEANRADFRRLLANCAVSVSQGGYNTVIDLFAARARPVIVPFARSGETEQAERAARLERLGLAVVLDEARLDAAALADAVDRALALAPLDPAAIRLDGARTTARLLASWGRHG